MEPAIASGLREGAVEAFEGMAVAFAYLFGSHMTGRTHPGSDVDIAVYVDPGIDAKRYLPVSQEVAGRLADKSAVAGIEVVVLNDAPLRLLGRIISGRAVIFSRDEPVRVEFESRKLREFFDFELHAREHDRAFLTRLAVGQGSVMVDSARLQALLERIGEEVGRLTLMAQRSDEHLIGDPDGLAAAKYRFIVAIEACIDIAQHVIASEGLRAPMDLADGFAILGEAGLIPSDLVPELQGMARFWNLLVHGYARVDDRQVIAILRTRLGDLEAFSRPVARAALG